MMINVDRDLHQYTALLRNKIREQGFTQLEVQEVLGWGRSYISQLLTKQKALRVEQVLLILKVIGVDPGAFFAEIYVASPRSRPPGSVSSKRAAVADTEQLRQEIERTKALLTGLTKLLREKGLISASGLSEAVKDARRDLD